MLPRPPEPEPASTNTLDGLAPGFVAKLVRLELMMRQRGWQPVRRETLRTEARQQWLFGFGRTWDDDRGIVTNAATATKGWHFFGLATDYGDERYEAGSEPPAFFADLEACAVAEGLRSGSDWKRKDEPHVQFGPGMRDTPSDEAVALFESGGLEAVWRAVGALEIAS